MPRKTARPASIRPRNTPAAVRISGSNPDSGGVAAVTVTTVLLLGVVRRALRGCGRCGRCPMSVTAGLPDACRIMLLLPHTGDAFSGPAPGSSAGQSGRGAGSVIAASCGRRCASARRCFRDIAIRNKPDTTRPTQVHCSTERPRQLRSVSAISPFGTNRTRLARPRSADRADLSLIGCCSGPTAADLPDKHPTGGRVTRKCHCHPRQRHPAPPLLSTRTSDRMWRAGGDDGSPEAADDSKVFPRYRHSEQTGHTSRSAKDPLRGLLPARPGPTPSRERVILAAESNRFDRAGMDRRDLRLAQTAAVRPITSAIGHPTVPVGV